MQEILAAELSPFFAEPNRNIYELVNFMLYPTQKQSIIEANSTS